MPFPQDSNNRRRVEGGNPIQAIADYLNEQHGGNYMIWNVSEESYDYSLFNDQVLEYKVPSRKPTKLSSALASRNNDRCMCGSQFPGHPAPPLGLLFKICTSIES